MSDYDRIARAIAYLADNVARQPRLDEVAAHVNLSPFHFQRVFSRWAGTSPKRLLQMLTLQRSKQLLQESGSLMELTHAVGLSSGSRLHEHFVRLEAVTPGEYRSRGSGLRIAYGVHETPFGEMFVAVTPRGICRAAFLGAGGADAELAGVALTWPLADVQRSDGATRPVADAMTASGACRTPLGLHVAGTNFQLSVWRALLTIPAGAVISYSRLAHALGRPRAARAVGNAVGANPVALLIPCHRVILGSGALGDYRWGPVRKRAVQVWERARLEADSP